MTLRVIAGSHKGRLLKTPDGQKTRPTTDRVKESVFSMLGPSYLQKACLDLFAGSGSLGIEALSRGVERATFVDSKSGDIIRANLEALGLSNRAQVLRMPYAKAVAYLKDKKESFDLVFADPPYQAGILEDSLARLLDADLLAVDATIVAEMHAQTATFLLPGFRVAKEVIYGIVKIVIYKTQSDRLGE